MNAKLFTGLFLLLLGIGGLLYARHHREQVSTRFARVIAEEARTPVDLKNAKEQLAELDLSREQLRQELEGRSKFMASLKSENFYLSIDTKQRKVARRVGFSLEGRADPGRLMTGFGESPVPIGIVVEPAGGKAYVALSNADRVAVIDLASFTVSGMLTAGREPDGMAYSPLAPGGPSPDKVPPNQPGGNAR